MEEMDKVLKDNLTKTRFAILVEKSREKMRNGEKNQIYKPLETVKPGKVINVRAKSTNQSNVTLFPPDTIEKYTKDEYER